MRNLLTLFIILLFSLCARAQGPDAGIVGTSTALCTDIPITFSAVSTSTGALTYTWAVVPARGLRTYSDLNSPTVSLTFGSIANCTVFLNVTNASGITTVTHTNIVVNKSANASFNARFNATGFPTQLILTNYSSNSLKNVWKFSENMSYADSALNVIREYNSSGNYTVTLEAIGTKGCNDISTYEFRISDSSSVELPTIFTPNGDDANDVFRPITRGIYSLNGWVYSRSGVLVCKWDKVKGGWDGHSTSGEECSDGVYFVIVEAYGFDGKTYKLKGNITLVR